MAEHPETSLAAVAAAHLARLGGRDRRRRDELACQLPETARALARAFAAGLPLDLAAERAADAVGEPAAGLLRRAAADLRAGARPLEALAPLSAAPGGALIAAAVDLNAQLGGDLVAALHALGDGLADRERLRGELDAATAQARFAGRVVPLVPLGAIAFLRLVSPASVDPLLTTPLGLAACAGSASLTLAALLLMRRITRAAAP